VVPLPQISFIAGLFTFLNILAGDIDNPLEPPSRRITFCDRSVHVDMRPMLYARERLAARVSAKRQMHGDLTPVPRNVAMARLSFGASALTPKLSHPALLRLPTALRSPSARIHTSQSGKTASGKTVTAQSGKGVSFGDLSVRVSLEKDLPSGSAASERLSERGTAGKFVDAAPAQGNAAAVATAVAAQAAAPPPATSVEQRRKSLVPLMLLPQAAASSPQIDTMVSGLEDMSAVPNPRGLVDLKSQ